ncbi:hypothetical protein E2C01_099139 [Portunus trituberculatus]|uniref:Uncharacterized protein n=1 Tax=Portunus trituberculatus TaxID=210409 RepID=A0A5B7KEM6_PORTR|nr:hypothetical protein [Portunus trituberculatus]
MAQRSGAADHKGRNRVCPAARDVGWLGPWGRLEGWVVVGCGFKGRRRGWYKGMVQKEWEDEGDGVERCREEVRMKKRME